MTINEIVTDVAKALPVSERKVRRLLHRLKIKPLGEVASRPQRWPDDSAQKIRAALGVNGSNGHAGGADDGKLVSMAALKRKRTTARKAA
jgi:hypothetical protein